MLSSTNVDVDGNVHGIQHREQKTYTKLCFKKRELNKNCDTGNSQFSIKLQFRDELGELSLFELFFIRFLREILSSFA